MRLLKNWILLQTYKKVTIKKKKAYKKARAK